VGVATARAPAGRGGSPGLHAATRRKVGDNRGYPNLLKVFDFNDDFVRKADPCVEFFANTVEPMCRAYKDRKFGEMFTYLGHQPTIKQHSDKVAWQKDMAVLNGARTKGTIGAVIDVLKATERPHLSERVLRREHDLQAAGPIQVEGESRSTTRYREMRNVAYSEMINLIEFLDGETPFATQHSVKGAQFENVLVVLGGGWNHYNWPSLFELLETKKLTDKNEKGFYRARNLFYVAISRPEVRLAVLATQQMTPLCLTTVTRLFGADHVYEVPLPV
jgi:DNA helicase II / ATP-dependent DNA helicase PcrA